MRRLKKKEMQKRNTTKLKHSKNQILKIETT
jgi:hypothetical protein